MAAIPVTISGVLADKFGRTIQSVTLFGDLTYSNVGVGGGPLPGGGGGPVDPGYGIPGGIPGTRPPPGSVDPGWGWTPGAHPEHPIYIPSPPIEPPDPPTEGKPPPPEGGWAWHPEWGWVYAPGPSEPTPKG